ncbi:hypothetical protein MKX01_001947 [Papaver californicum]|nr:hypothetical protein MKX01_001947 [Papaver californicum]
MTKTNEQGILVWRRIPGLENEFTPQQQQQQWRGGNLRGVGVGFASVSMIEEKSRENNKEKEFFPSTDQFLKHPLALLALVPKDAALFAAGAVAGAAAKTFTAPLDRVKLLMQIHGLRIGEGSAKKAIRFLEAISVIGKEEGIKGYWKGNLPQVIRVIPYSAAQLFAYEAYKKLFKGDGAELSILGRLAAGACAGMTSTLVALSMLRDEGVASFYNGLGPSLIGIAPYIAVNFCIFDLVKKALPEKYQKRTETSLATALVSATLATLMCYPLDTVRRQMQMRGSPYKMVLDAIPGIIERDGVIGLYRGVLPNALKNLPNSSIRLTTFDTVKSLITSSQKEHERIVEENREKTKLKHLFTTKQQFFSEYVGFVTDQISLLHSSLMSTSFMLMAMLYDIAMPIL